MYIAFVVDIFESTDYLVGKEKNRLWFLEKLSAELPTLIESTLQP